MRRLIPIFIFSILLFSAHSVFAQSSASVNVQNNINSSSTSDSKIESHTDITVETNGEVTRYTSDEPNQKIEVKSSNGESSIKVDGEEVLGEDAEVKISPTITTTDSSKEEITATPTPINKVAEFIKEKFSFVEKFFSFLGSLGK